MVGEKGYVPMTTLVMFIVFVIMTTVAVTIILGNMSFFAESSSLSKSSDEVDRLASAVGGICGTPRTQEQVNIDLNDDHFIKVEEDNVLVLNNGDYKKEVASCSSICIAGGSCEEGRIEDSITDYTIEETGEEEVSIS